SIETFINTNLNGGVGPNIANVWHITGADSGTLVNAWGNFPFSVGTLTGGTDTDLFSFEGGSLSGSINGGTGPGANTIQVDTARTFTITGTDAGTLSSGLASGFTNVGNLKGGSGDDQFTFGASGSLTGNIDGGSNTATGDTITGNDS